MIDGTGVITPHPIEGGRCAVAYGGFLNMVTVGGDCRTGQELEHEVIGICRIDRLSVTFPENVRCRWVFLSHAQPLGPGNRHLEERRRDQLQEHEQPEAMQYRGAPPENSSQARDEQRERGRGHGVA